MITLLGPQPFDPEAPGRAARALLDAFAVDPDGLERSESATAPGMYLIVDEDGALRGFWIVLSEAWLDEGANGGVTPPFAKGVFDACTEELWWERFRVAPLVLEAWRPLIVLEWPAPLAERSSLPPPGKRVAAPDARRTPSDGRWLRFDDHDADVAAREAERERQAPWASLPEQRSLLCLIRGSLRWNRAVHQGRFELVHLAGPDEAGMGIASMPGEWRRRGVPLEEWLDMAAGQATRPEGEHRLGHPLQLPGGRVGFPMTGWLSRDLEIQPPRPGDAAVGQLVSRDTRNPVLSQAAMAVSITIFLLLGTLGFSGGLRWVAQPVLEGAAPAIEPAAQPAFSVCSAEHRRFVEQLSCQVQALAAGEGVTSRTCDAVSAGHDLQAAWCGLRDRDLDGALTPSGHPWADTAAAQACFEVLGHPWEYALSGPGDNLANPSKLLDDGRLRVNALVEIVAALDAGCEAYRDRATALVDGAILGAHVGWQAHPGEPLRELAAEIALRNQPAGARACFRAGLDEGPERAETWKDMCGPAEIDLPPTGVRAGESDGWYDPWRSLGGPAPAEQPSVIVRYVDARFSLSAPRDGRWACYARLREGQARGESPGWWDLSVPVPPTFGAPGVTRQLDLDAWLLAARSGSPPDDVCWLEVERILAGYTPVHPLVGMPAEGGWPSEEQQICGQICAAAYRIVPGRHDRWVTAKADLRHCIDRSPPQGELGGPDGRFDRLRLPWNAARDGSWVEPTDEDVCAFHLIAQGLVSGVLPEKVAPAAWAGQPASGSRVAGGLDGLAAQAAVALTTYGRSRSSSTCARVAAQCFVGELLAVTSDPTLGPQSWHDAWSQRVEALAHVDASDPASRPWCRILRPYLSPGGRLPEGELDMPCALGIAETRERTAAVLDDLVTAAFQARAR